MKLTFESVEYRRGGRTFSFSAIFDEGVHLITGAVGSGKTTLASLAAGLISPDRGRVIMTDIRSTALSFSHPEYHITESTIAGEVRSWGHEPGPILRNLGIEMWGDRDPLTLSRGELKRLELACQLAGDHDLVILDEPFTALDCPARRWAADLIGRRKRKITLVLTHENEVLPRVDRIWRIEGGNLSCIASFPESITLWPGSVDGRMQKREKRCRTPDSA
ncbi:MAG: ATP-binding cassette domain-containing protein [Methanoculleaceae archaeon]